MDRGVSKIELTAILAILIVATTIAFIFGTTRHKKKVENSPTPVFTPTSNGPQLNSPPQVTLTPKTTVILSPTPLVSVVPKPSISGVKGLATLKSCNYYNTCTTTAVAQMKIDVKSTIGTLIKTVNTDASGQYGLELNPGSYIIGPFKDPTTSAVVNAATIKVNSGYYTEVNVKFESTQ